MEGLKFVKIFSFKLALYSNNIRALCRMDKWSKVFKYVLYSGLCTVEQFLLQIGRDMEYTFLKM